MLCIKEEFKLTGLYKNFVWDKETNKIRKWLLFFINKKVQAVGQTTMLQCLKTNGD